MYDFRFIKKVLYRLKRDFGAPIEIVWNGPQSVDFDTGDITRDADSVSVDRAIVLPERQEVSFQYALPFIASSKNFTHGGFFDTVQRLILIDESDLESDFRINTDQYIVYNNVRYDILKVDHYNYAWWLTAKQAEGVVSRGIVKQSVVSTLHMNQEATND